MSYVLWMPVFLWYVAVGVCGPSGPMCFSSSRRLLRCWGAYDVARVGEEWRDLRFFIHCVVVVIYVLYVCGFYRVAGEGIVSFG